MSFTVAAAQDALLAMLSARPALAGAHIADGLRDEVPDENDRLYMLRVRDLQRERAIEQPALMAEDYDLYLLASVYRPDTVANTEAEADRTAARARLWEIVEEVSATCQEDEELGGAADEAELVSVPDATVTRTADGWIAEAIVVVHVHALRS